MLPPTADLIPAAEPRLGDNPSAATLDQYDVDHEAWGRGESGKVSRLCWWYKDMGIKLDCGPRQH